MACGRRRVALRDTWGVWRPPGRTRRNKYSDPVISNPTPLLPISRKSRSGEERKKDWDFFWIYNILFDFKISRNKLKTNDYLNVFTFSFFTDNSLVDDQPVEDSNFWQFYSDSNRNGEECLKEIQQPINNNKADTLDLLLVGLEQSCSESDNKSDFLPKSSLQHYFFENFQNISNWEKFLVRESNLSLSNRAR